MLYRSIPTHFKRWWIYIYMSLQCHVSNIELIRNYGIANRLGRPRESIDLLVSKGHQVITRSFHCINDVLFRDSLSVPSFKGDLGSI